DGSSSGNSSASRSSSAPTVCWPSSSSVVSGTPARSRSVAKNRIVTCINQLLQNNIAGLAAALLDQADGLDAHFAVDSFGHIVDRERGYTCGGQCFHLNARPADGSHRGLDQHARVLLVKREVNVHVCELERVTVWDEFGGALGGHDSGDAGHGEHVALFDRALADQRECLWLHADMPAHHGDALGLSLAPNVDHCGAPGLIQVREFAQCCSPNT